MNKLQKELQTLGKEFDALTRKTNKLKKTLRKKAAAKVAEAQARVEPEAVARRTAEALRSLTQTIETIIEAVEKSQKDQFPKKKKARVKAKSKGTIKKKGQTATDQVVRVIRRYKIGVDVPTLMRRTGLEEKQVRNIVFRALKRRNIKRVRRGFFVGA